MESLLRNREIKYDFDFRIFDLNLTVKETD